jgi:hypothetical protein
MHCPDGFLGGAKRFQHRHQLPLCQGPRGIEIGHLAHAQARHGRRCHRRPIVAAPTALWRIDRFGLVAAKVPDIGRSHQAVVMIEVLDRLGRSALRQVTRCRAGYQGAPAQPMRGQPQIALLAGADRHIEAFGDDIDHAVAEIERHVERGVGHGVAQGERRDEILS